MKPYPRLARRQLLTALRAHAKEHGVVSIVSLHAHDPEVLRSLPLHFVGIAAAREAAGVLGPPRRITAKTGPKPGTVTARRPSLWSRDRVIRELRALHRRGRRTAWADLMRSGHTDLLHAAQVYAGGLRSARELAGIAAPPRRSPKKRWNATGITQLIQQRYRQNRPLSFSEAPPVLVSAGVRHFGSWAAALRSANVDPATARKQRKKYTRETIIAMLRREAERGSDLRALTLAKVMKLESVRREFGTLRDALLAAGLADVLMRRKHGLQKWSRERVIEVLRERAARRVYTLTPGLHRVVQLYFGGAEAARRAAGVPSPVDVAIAVRRAPSNQRAAHRRRVTRDRRMRKTPNVGAGDMTGPSRSPSTGRRYRQAPRE